jgi:hypothetical protein
LPPFPDGGFGRCDPAAISYNFLRSVSWSTIMKSHRWFLASLLLVAMHSPSPAQGPLAWRFRQGDRFFVEEVTKVRQTIKIMGSETRQDLEQTKVLLYTILGQDADGNVAIAKKTESVKATLAAGNSPPDTKFLQQTVGALFTITLDPTGQIVRLVGYDDLIQKIGKEPGAAKLARVLVSEDVLKNTDERLFHCLPAKGRAQASWQSKSRVPLGPLGTMTAIDDYRLTSNDVEGSVKKITVASKLRYVPPGENSDYPLKVVRGFLKPEEAAGTILFDTARGRVVEAHHRRVVHGSLTLAATTGTVDMDLHQEQTVTLRVLDKNPLEK